MYESVKRTREVKSACLPAYLLVVRMDWGMSSKSHDGTAVHSSISMFI